MFQVPQPYSLVVSTPPADTHSSGHPSWRVSTHQDWPHLTENQEGSQLHVFTVAVLQRNRSKSCRVEKTTPRQAVNVTPLLSWSTQGSHTQYKEQRSQCPMLGADFLPGCHRSHPDGWGGRLQNTALTDRSIQRSEVKNTRHLEMKMTHSERIKTHRTLHIEFRATTAVVSIP